MKPFRRDRAHKWDAKAEKRPHPPGLKGREIGLYYRNLSRNNKEVEENEIKLGPDVSVPKEMLKKVKQHLSKSEQDVVEESTSSQFSKYAEYTDKTDLDELLQKAQKNRADIPNPTQQTQNPTHNEHIAKTNEKRLSGRKLPVHAKSKSIIEAIKNNQVLLIAGSTGCGKTTQIPQLLLDAYKQEQCKSFGIVCTQPRRISAISIAERVAYERGEALGKSVGFQIRLENVLPTSQCGILYCTTGILLQKMQADPLLGYVKAIFLDEIHERSVETDLLMALIKKILPYRPDLRVILMSATLRETDFAEYFNDCEMFYIDGTLFTVTMCYLEDIIQETGFRNFKQKPTFRKAYGNRQLAEEEKYFNYKRMITPYIKRITGDYDRFVLDALQYTDSEGCDNLQFIEHLIFYICKHKPPGAILVFLPSYDKISKLNAALKKPTQSIANGLENQIQVYALHSRMLSSNQKHVFLPPPSGMRKVILSTNIAETSITIDDVVYVINTGRAKVSQYNITENIQTLEEVWVTKANTQQRKGRAGRVQKGICYNLFTKAREAIMDEVPTPEILCTKLDSIILNLKLLHINDVESFMATLLSPPEKLALQTGINLLKRIGALDSDECITPLGIHLAHLPLDPQIAKMVLMSALFRCFDPITTIAASLSFKTPFYAPLGKEKIVDRIKLELAEGCRSDHLLIHNVVEKYRESLEQGCRNDFCYKNFLSWTVIEQLESMKQQFAGYLKSVKFLESSECAELKSNKNSDNTTLLRAIISAGLYPNMAFLRKARKIKNRVFTIHSMSTPEERKKSNGVKIMDATMIFPMALIIFGDRVEVGTTHNSEPYISVANAYFFKCDSETAEVVLALRKRLEWLMLKKALYPAPIDENSNEEEIVKAIQILLSIDAYVEDVGTYDDDDDGDEDNYDEDD